MLVTEIENTFWGTVLQGKNQYEHKSERPVHLSMAALDTSSTHDEYIPVMVQNDSHSYILCTLNAPNCLQQILDLEINKGETVTFSLNGNGVVHLTGYFIQEELVDDMPEDNQEMMNYMHEHGENCVHDDEFDDGVDDDDDEDDDDIDDDDDDDDDLDGDDDEEDEEEDEMNGEDDDDEDDQDDDEEEEQNIKTNGKKRKLELQENQSKKQRKNDKKNKKQDIEDEDEEEEPPKLVKSNQQQKNKIEDKKQKQTNGNANNKQESKPKNVNGVEIKDLKVGTGAEAKKGKYVHVYYQGKLKQNGKQFDACQSGKPFKFRLGSGEVIKGWDIGVAGMKVGSKRLLTIPPNLAYGNQKLGGIPPNSTLVFEVELKAVS